MAEPGVVDECKVEEPVAERPETTARDVTTALDTISTLRGVAMIFTERSTVG